MAYINGYNGSALDHWKNLPTQDKKAVLRESVERELASYQRRTLALSPKEIYGASEKTALTEAFARILIESSEELLPAIPGLLVSDAVLPALYSLWQAEKAKRPAGEPFQDTVLRYARRISASAAQGEAMAWN